MCMQRILIHCWICAPQHTLTMCVALSLAPAPCVCLLAYMRTGKAAIADFCILAYEFNRILCSTQLSSPSSSPFRLNKKKKRKYCILILVGSGTHFRIHLFLFFYWNLYQNALYAYENRTEKRRNSNPILISHCAGVCVFVNALAKYK